MVRHLDETLGMTDEEVTAGLEKVQHARDDLALGLQAEINEHVPQEDDLKVTEVRQGLVEIHPHKPDFVAQRALRQAAGWLKRGAARNT